MCIEYKLIILLSKPYLSYKEKEDLVNVSNSYLNWDLVYGKLKRHHIVSIAFCHLKTNKLEAVIPDEIFKKLYENFENNKLKQEVYLQEISPIFKELKNKKIKFCVLKGMVLQNLLYPKYSRTFRDIDIMICKNDYSQVRNILNQYGFSNDQDLNIVENKRERLFLLLNTYEFPEFKKKQIMGDQNINLHIDVQHSHMLATKMGYVIDVKNELKYCEEMIIENIKIYRQRLDYLLLNLCTHAFGDCTIVSEIILGKAFRLKCFGDIVGLVEKFSDFYLSNEFYDFIIKTNTIKPIYFCLYYCSKIYQVSNSFKQILKKLSNKLTDYSFINQYGFENGHDVVLNWECNLENKLFSEESIMEVKNKAKKDIEKYANYDTRINI